MRDGWLIKIMKNTARRLRVKYAPFNLKTGSFLPVYGWESTDLKYPIYAPLDVPSALEETITADILRLKFQRKGLRLLSISAYILIEENKFNILLRFVK